MAYIEPRKNKNGEIIAYRIRVNKGYDKNGKKLKPYEFTFKPDPKKTERQNLKALNEAANHRGQFSINMDISPQGTRTLY